MLTFLLIVNRRGQVRVRKYYRNASPGGAAVQQHEPELIRKCLGRDDNLCSFFDFHNSSIVLRKYSALYFIVGITPDENELGIWEFIHNIVETFNDYFQRVTELDPMCWQFVRNYQITLNVDRVHMILDEMISEGRIVETCRQRVLAPLRVIDQTVKK